MTDTQVGTSTPSASGAQRGPSIYDVAKAAGVAPSTVSRAFSRPGRVNSRTAERVFAAARDVGYRSEVLHGLAGQRTRSLAVVVTDITNPFYSEIIRGAHEAAGESGYTILLSHTQEDAQLERDWTERELGAVEGVLLTSSRMSHNAIRMLAKQKPMVLLNRRVPEVPCVITDNARGMRRAVEHLAELGHQTVTYVAGPEASWADGMRWVALMEACHELDLRFRRVGPCNVPTVHAGFDTAQEVLAQKADGRDRLQRRDGHRRHQGDAQGRRPGPRRRQRHRLRQRRAGGDRRPGADHRRGAAAGHGDHRRQEPHRRHRRGHPEPRADRAAGQARRPRLDRPSNAGGPQP